MAKRCKLRIGLGNSVVAVLMFAPCGCTRNSSTADEQDAEDGALVLDSDEPTPVFEFPDSVRCSNDSLNEFLEEFRSICERGEYDRYRLALSRQLEPVQKGQFERIWLSVKHIRVELIKKLPEIKAIPSPAFAVLLRAQLREEAMSERPERQLTVVVFQEQGEWVFAPPPDDRISQAMKQAASQPADESAESIATSRPASD